jgi:hypothetical protein
MAAANSGSVGRGKVFVPVVHDRVKDTQGLKRVTPVLITISHPATSCVREVDARAKHTAQ